MTPSPHSKRFCIFCSETLSGQKSNEHIFPRWLQEHLSLTKINFSHIQYKIDGTIADYRSLVFNKHVTGLVCQRCNNHWLSDLESRLKRFLIPLVDGSFSGRLSQRECQIISKWVYKTILTHASTSFQKDTIPTEHYSDFCGSTNIPVGVIIAMAPVELEDYDEISFILHSGWSGKADEVSQQALQDYFSKSYKVTIRTGHVAWRVTYFHQKHIPPISLNEYRNDAIKYIHPIRRNGVSWPPIGIIDDLMEFDMSFVYMDKYGFGM